jgi:hypothetical protein
MMEYGTPRENGWRFNLSIVRGALPAIELAGCAILLAVFWVYYRQAEALPQPLNQIDIGAGGFPVLLAIGTILAIVAVGLSALVLAFDAVPANWMSIRRPVSVVIGVILLIAQSIWFEELGVMPSVIVFAAATMLACGERRIIHLIGVPLALAAFVYSVFVLTLSVNLP